MTEVTHKKHSPDRLRILVVEDSDVQKIIFLKLLTGVHFVRTAADVKEGWKCYLEVSPHIVFLDIGLPDGNGNDLAKMIKDHNQKVHIVMATSNSDKANKERAAHNRVDGFMVKPINTTEVNEHISRFLAIHQRDLPWSS